MDKIRFILKNFAKDKKKFQSFKIYGFLFAAKENKKAIESNLQSLFVLENTLSYSSMLPTILTTVLEFAGSLVVMVIGLLW